MGIGLPEEIDYPVEAFVLEKFGKDERKAAEKMIEDAATAVETIIEQDIEAAQHKYN